MERTLLFHSNISKVHNYIIYIVYTVTVLKSKNCKLEIFFWGRSYMNLLNSIPSNAPVANTLAGNPN